MTTETSPKNRPTPPRTTTATTPGSLATRTKLVRVTCTLIVPEEATDFDPFATLYYRIPGAGVFQTNYQPDGRQRSEEVERADEG